MLGSYIHVCMYVCMYIRMQFLFRTSQSLPGLGSSVTPLCVEPIGSESKKKFVMSFRKFPLIWGFAVVCKRNIFLNSGHIWGFPSPMHLGGEPVTSSRVFRGCSTLTGVKRRPNFYFYTLDDKSHAQIHTFRYNNVLCICQNG